MIGNMTDSNAEEVLKKSAKYFRISQLTLPSDLCSLEYQKELSKFVMPNKKGRFLVFMKASNTWYEFKSLQKVKNSVLDSLDVSYLSTNLLANVLKIADIKTSDDIEYIPETKGDISALQNKCLADDLASILIICPRISLNEVKAVADTHNCMPPKSTFIYPKPLIGLLFKTFEPLE